MNGTIENEKKNHRIDRRPIVTCAGELEVFSPIEEALSNSLPSDSCEWRRSLGRPVRNVRIEASFNPFSPAALPKPAQWDLIRKPLFHTYWTECNDVDLYKTTVREDIENWLKELSSREITDWLIVVVENFDGKRAKQLIPRTTVLDKIRADFTVKQGDRCISVINPGKAENKTAESWRGLVGRVRHLLLVAYARAVSRLEDYVRYQREKRNEPGWNFMNYFYLQEELAQVLQMLGLHDEALVQYDELDALFSQCVTNFSASNTAKWLCHFQRPLEKWHGLKLTTCRLEDSPSLLELRAYIFARQAQMLLSLKKIWDMASRCLPFLYTCVRELNILEITAPPGALWCWLFLASMEVLQACDKHNQADQVEEYSLHTASLWMYASQNLRNLAELCGLMPQSVPSSEQLHIVVSLSAGMGDNPGSGSQPSPTDRLKEVLCSQEAFIKTYLELAELAMGTFKHIGRLRMARLVGKEVASFYLLLDQTQKAAAFLGDAVRTFESDGWHELVAQTQVALADCHKKANDINKFVAACAVVSTALEMDTLIRWSYFDEMTKYLNKLDKLVNLPFNDIFKIHLVRVVGDLTMMQGDNLIVELSLESNFPKEILCSYVSLALGKEDQPNANIKYNSGKLLTNKDLKWQDPFLQRLKIEKILDYKQDKQLASSGVTTSTNVFHRKDSALALKKTDSSMTLEADKLPVLLTPGMNLIKLNRRISDIARYYLDYVDIHIDNLLLISPQLLPRITINVCEESPSVRLYKRAAPLISGIEQVMNLILTIGSYLIEPKSTIRLTSSPGLYLRIDLDQPLTNNLDIEIGDKPTFSSTKIPIRVLADLLTKEHQVTIHVPWITKPTVVSLSFSTPMSTTWRLFTVVHRKFIQVNVVGHCVDNLLVQGPDLKMKDVNISPKHTVDSSLIISNGLSYSFLWELLYQETSLNSIKTEFNLQYKLSESDSYKLYQYFFDITDYKTLYIVDAAVESAKENEFCRVGVVCHLYLSITDISPNNCENRSVMYEVLAEQNVWAVCGRTAGVVSFNSGSSDNQDVVLDVMPLTSGYLPLPLVRISKYIPAEQMSTEKNSKFDIQPKLEPFSSGQVYNKSKGKQIHVLATVSEGNS